MARNQLTYNVTHLGPSETNSQERVPIISVEKSLHCGSDLLISHLPHQTLLTCTSYMSSMRKRFLLCHMSA